VNPSSAKTLSAPWLVRLNWDELGALLVCLTFDLVEYGFPMLMMPIGGDFFDVAGILFCAYFLGWIGLISIFELLPGIDIIPTFTLTWIAWYILKRRKDDREIEKELERWK